MIDCHVHTRFSTDSEMYIVDAIRRAKELNIGIIITEHMDYKYPVPGEFVFNPYEYLKEYSKYRNDRILLGVEMGLRPDSIEENRRLANENKFDYIIGSVHVVDNVDLYQGEFYQDREKKEAYEHYLKFMLECVKNYDFFDALGHIDYITRYARFSDKEIYYKEFQNLIDEVLKELAIKEKAIEINTRRLNDFKAVENLKVIYNRFYELGGKFVTLGSDSHSTDSIGANFAIGKEIADMCKLKTVYFKERKLHYS
jgi:histidinol-phosphatase (PHP family)